MEPEPNDPNPLHWSALPDEQLLQWRICDLELKIMGPLEDNIRQLYQELDARGINFHPPCYLGDEWFSPSGVPVISLPFYLAHPRLKELEKKMMLEVEGGTDTDCLKLLRHETGHAICHAFALPRRQQWRKIFGSPAVEFKDYYRFQPYSKRFVRHLENWYAQSHPEEDFAETFAVWLAPGPDWRLIYQGWPALEKLEYVDRLMRDLGPTRSEPDRAPRPFDASRLRRRLKTHYEQRRKFYAEDDPAFLDRDLRRLFSAQPAVGKPIRASRFLQRQRRPILNAVAFWARERKFTVNRILKRIMIRCDELELYLPADENRSLLEIAAFLTALVSNYLFTGRLKRRL